MASRAGVRLTIARHEGEPGPVVDFDGLLEIAYRGPNEFQADYASTWGDGFRLTCAGGKAFFDSLLGGELQIGEAGPNPLADGQGLNRSRFAAILAGPESAARLIPSGAQAEVRATSAMRRRIVIRANQRELILDIARTNHGWVLEAALETTEIRFSGFVQRSETQERLISISPLD